jgi:hypothetical protein
MSASVVPAAGRAQVPSYGVGMLFEYCIYKKTVPPHSGRKTKKGGQKSLFKILGNFNFHKINFLYLKMFISLTKH